MATRVEHIGHREAMAALKSLPDRMKVRAADEIEVTAFQFERMAEARVRVRTGLLKARLARKVNKRTPRGDVGFEGPEAFYWKYLEYGTVNMSAKPFLRPTAEALKEDHHRRMDLAMERAGNDIASGASRLL